VTDGQNVYVFFPERGLISFGKDGKQRWESPLGPFNNHHGLAASPILAEDKVVMLCDQDTNAFLLAVYKDNGRIAWRTRRSEVIQSFTTPILYRPPEGSPQIIISGSFQLIAYALDSGEKLWWVTGMSWQPKTVPLLGRDLIFVHSNTWGTGDPGKQVALPPFAAELQEHDTDKDGRLSISEANGPSLRESWIVVDLDKDGTLDEHEWETYRDMLNGRNGLFAIRPGGRGDLTKTNVLWSYFKSLPNVSSPVLYKDVIYLVKDGGILTSLDCKTGQVLKQARLQGALDQYFASPVAADDKVFLVSESGKITVVKAGPDWEILALNDIREDSYATPAIANGRLYVRTTAALYCFGNLDRKPEPPAIR
jgi:outer membrane protein assembly factor BamB